jgi:hypothetical protein
MAEPAAVAEPAAIAEPAVVTELGTRLKHGNEDYLRLRAGDRWWGATRVPRTSKWRYDPGSPMLTER